MRRSEVEQLQRNLVVFGYDLGRSGSEGDGVDGYFGGETRRAIERLGREIRPLFDAPGEPSKRLLQLIDLLADGGWNATPSPGTVADEPPRHSARLAYQDTLLIRDSPQADLVREAQRHLRQLGYLRRGIDGLFGEGTGRAVRALQFDLLYTDDTTAGAPVSVRDHNRGRVSEATGRIDPETAACIRDLLDDPRFILLPSSQDPEAENARIDAFTTNLVPLPFLQAILRQESGLKHFEVPTDGDEDHFIVVGLDTNDASHPEHVTSRGQYTLFHHPPVQAEVDGFMGDVAANLRKAAEELREKFDRFVAGRTGGTRADDRLNEVGTGPLRLCQYAPTDPRYLTDCRRCVREAGHRDIVAGETPWHPGTAKRYQTTPYHPERRLEGVPIRANMACDWPYAIRRYNGSGVNSYWYQAKVLLEVQRG